MKGKDHNIAKELGFSLLAEGKTIRIRADGYSMFPAIKAGSLIYIEPDIDPSPGEIIAWKREEGFVVHRLVRIVSDGDRISYITRGDSCVREDQPVKKEHIAGRVISIESTSGDKSGSEKKMISRFDYIYNRLRVWLILRYRRARNIAKRIINEQ